MTRRRRLLLLGLAALVPVLGVGVALSGVISLRASAGHFAVTEWLLQLGKRRSVAAHAIVGPPLDLDEPGLLVKGATAYHVGCFPCHGGPDRTSSFQQVVRAMLPPPPDLRSATATWSPDELFQIVKHGLKLTGMPAWPAQRRDDEVRAVVAFLVAVPGLDEAGYRRLVFGDEASLEREGDVAPVVTGVAPATLAACARCHGADGLGHGSPAFPVLAGQKAGYLERALRAYGRGERHSGIMQPAAAALLPAEPRALAAHYAGLPRAGPAAVTSAASEAVARGRRLASEGDPARRVPSCVDCHGPGPEARNPAYPDLAGQPAEYLALQLELFAADARGGSSYAHLMSHVAPRLTPEQRRDLATYYASLR